MVSASEHSDDVIRIRIPCEHCGDVATFTMDVAAAAAWAQAVSCVSDGFVPPLPALQAALAARSQER